MSNGLYEPEDCESERTVIISELQGGENDPDQLLDQEVTAMAFRAHPYRHPTIGWLPDLRSMTRDDLYGHYRRYYIPNNATLVVAGDVDADDVLRRVGRTLGAIAPGPEPPRASFVEPPQLGERRVVVERPGTTAYLKLAWHAPAATDPDFFPMLVLDAVLTGAKGMNLWSSFRGAPPQRKARLYTSLVERSLAVERVRCARADGPAVPVHHLDDGHAGRQPRSARIGGARGARPRSGGRRDRRGDRPRPASTARSIRVRDRQRHEHRASARATSRPSTGPGFFNELQSRVARVTAAEVSEAARRRLLPANRTVGWFQPQAAPESQA